MPKVAILLPDLRGGGAERVSLDLARTFVSRGIGVEFVLLNAEGEFVSEALDLCPIIDLRCRRIRHLPLALSRYLRRYQVENLVVAMWPLTVVAPIVCSAVSPRTRVLVSEHGVLSKQYSEWGKVHNLALKASTGVGYRFAKARVGVSRGVADDMARLSGMARRLFTVINNPVRPPSEPNANALAEAESQWNAPSGARILNVGRLKDVKNQALLLRAFARVQGANARLMLLGAGELEDALRVLAANLGISDRVIFAGFHADPTPFYRTSDLFVLSSDREGFGNVIVEALATGTPVVSTDCPTGPAEILAGGEFGALVPVGDEEALVESMGCALASPHDPQRLRNRASDFAPEKAARAYLDLLGLQW